MRGREQDSLRRYVTLGALAGISALMRWQDAIILSVPCIDLLWRLMRGQQIGQVVTRGLVCVGAALVAFAPQMLVWQTLYGRPLAIPQGDSFMQWRSPALAAVLFSDWHGLFTWTPVIAVAVAGLAFLWRRDRLVCSAAVTFLLLSWYVNAAAADWWAGEAFGSRRFVSCFAVFCFGLGADDRTSVLQPESGDHRCGSDGGLHLPAAGAVSGFHARPPRRRPVPEGSVQSLARPLRRPIRSARAVVGQRVEWLTSRVAFHNGRSSLSSRSADSPWGCACSASPTGSPHLQPGRNTHPESGADVREGDLNPHNFVYPTLYFYLVFAWEGLFFVAARAAGVYDSLAAFQREFFIDPSRHFLAGRAFSVLCGTATVAAVFWLGRRLYDTRDGTCRGRVPRGLTDRRP